MMTYENEQREEHERELDQQEGDRVQDAIAYTERESANLHSAVKRLEKQNADLVATLYAAKFWMEGQHSTVLGDCGVCGSESPYHHGKCPKEQVEQALAQVENK